MAVNGYTMDRAEVTLVMDGDGQEMLGHCWLQFYGEGEERQWIQVPPPPLGGICAPFAEHNIVGTERQPNAPFPFGGTAIHWFGKTNV